MSEVVAGAAVTPAIARSFIDQARKKDYRHGVLGVRARPGATREATFTHAGQPVRIVPASSALAVREAIRTADPDGWLVVVTDRSDEDLGAGLLAQLTWQRLRHPDPWEAVRQRFGASNVDPRLLRTEHAREVAAGLLELAPPDGWPPAPAGVLTRDHALACAARGGLGLPEGPVDLITVLHWSTDPTLPTTIAELRRRAGDATADAVLAWIAESSGEAEPFVAALLRRGTPTDLVPLGVVLDCLLASEQDDAPLAVARLEHRWGTVPRGALLAAARLASIVVSGLLAGRTAGDARRLLARADDLMAEASAQHLAGGSRLLRSGLTRRLWSLAETLRTAPIGDPATLEAAWSRVAEHELVDDDPRVPAARAGVRLARWLHLEPDLPRPTTLGALASRHLDVDAWVDSAVNDAATGVDDHPLAEALERVVLAVQERRDSHDLAFAAALAREGCDPIGGGPDGDVHLLERILPEIVLPLAREHRTLLLVLDGLSAGVATEVLADVASTAEYGMTECLLPGASGRTAALAVLPSVTEASRASLLAGRLTTGQQDAERRHFADLTRAHGLEGAPLFHKKNLDSARPGFALADDVRVAIADTERHQLVACVLNTIDDALDRTDPGGTDWGAETVKHLAPLLRWARDAGRLVVITSDHGHVVERRQGVQRGTGLGARYRTAGGVPEDDEVLVQGPRVLTEDHRAILAVNERLRYGPLKAGYHGGASPAEVVVPVAVLAPTTLEHDLAEAPVAEPAWWDLTALAGTAPAVIAAEPVVAQSAPAEPQPDLFSAPPTPVVAGGTGTELVTSATYAAQKKLVGRVSVTDESVAALVTGLSAAPDRRLSATRVAALLGVQANRVPMVMSQVAKLLNVEGYPVVSSDPATQSVTLDLGLVAEQYGVSA